ncbi:O-methyltransferase [Tessaracoccus sp. ZS01]|uniref:O-methyltransferase n=1 Tax=Tessaracoccus sp. ZS01 TaxID=1906324 RepID=UPI00096CD2F1|nr:O-methyltransferase [Tessaracoccus sp. ZS01]MCG6568700.1 O-methyltransferase [Tessaracoccus sp. ZS01]OMG51960.1 methyltransferase [Tessaracoccus sp. ZS01]
MADTPTPEAFDALLAPLAAEDDALIAARTSTEVTRPGIEVSPSMGRLLNILASASGAKRVLEFGTLAGYSTIWLARAVGPTGRVVSLELERSNADVARRNFEAAGVSAWVDIMCGPAALTSGRLVELQVEPFDLVFIDADKASLPTYLERSIALTRPGALIVIDNVVRGGEVLNPDDDDSRGVRAALTTAGADPRLDVAAIQTVGAKGWDGFAVLRRTAS